MGLIYTKNNLSICEKLGVAAFCRRRLPVVMARLKFTQTVKEAVILIEQGRIYIYIYIYFFMPIRHKSGSRTCERSKLFRDTNNGRSYHLESRVKYQEENNGI